VTSLLEVHGIRAYRSTSNKLGRPIVLDTDFDNYTDDEPDDTSDDANYAKYRDDKGDDNEGGGDDK
jgi:hypothetical protein